MIQDVKGRVALVLQRMIELSNDELYAETFSEILEESLTVLADQDCFGTERQFDPRGDGRDGEWSMNRVQGIDK